jgi:hypothetical protein
MTTRVAMLPATIEEAPMQSDRRTFIKHTLAGGVALSGLGGILYSRQAPSSRPTRCGRWRRGDCRSAT